MAFFDPKDLFKPFGAIAALAGSAALGFVAGYAVGRDPTAARRLMRFVAGAFDHASLAVAETREELADLWADARTEARTRSEEAKFAEAAEVATASAAPEGAVEAPQAPKRAAKRARAGARKPRTRAARSTVVH